MEIQIDPHTIQRAEERGTNEGQIKDVINTGFSIPAKYGRIGKAKIYDFKRKRHDKYYEQKRVEVFYTIERDTIIHNNCDSLCLLRQMGVRKCRFYITPRQICFIFA